MSDARNHTEIKKVMDGFLKTFVNSVFNDSQFFLLENDSVDTGFLLRSGNVVRVKEGYGVNYSAPYAEGVEYGRLPGEFVPVDVLERWVRRKLGVGDVAEAKRIAFLVSQKIKNKGVVPRPFLRPAVNKNVKKYGLVTSNKGGVIGGA